MKIVILDSETVSKNNDVSLEGITSQSVRVHPQR